jgi:hypothetical protein
VCVSHFRTPVMDCGQLAHSAAEKEELHKSMVEASKTAKLEQVEEHAELKV